MVERILEKGNGWPLNETPEMIPSGKLTVCYLKMVILHSYVSLPKGKRNGSSSQVTHIQVRKW